MSYRLQGLQHFFCSKVWNFSINYEWSAPNMYNSNHAELINDDFQ